MALQLLRALRQDLRLREKFLPPEATLKDRGSLLFCCRSSSAAVWLVMNALSLVGGIRVGGVTCTS